VLTFLSTKVFVNPVKLGFGIVMKFTSYLLNPNSVFLLDFLSKFAAESSKNIIGVAFFFVVTSSEKFQLKKNLCFGFNVSINV
jgi:hypothetical protein